MSLSIYLSSRLDSRAEKEDKQRRLVGWIRIKGGLNGDFEWEKKNTIQFVYHSAVRSDQNEKGPAKLRPKRRHILLC